MARTSIGLDFGTTDSVVALGRDLGADLLDRVLLPGGTSLVPGIRRIFTDRSGSDAIEDGGEPTSIAHGLALGGLMAGADHRGFSPVQRGVKRLSASQRIGAISDWIAVVI